MTRFKLSFALLALFVIVPGSFAHAQTYDAGIDAGVDARSPVAAPTYDEPEAPPTTAYDASSGRARSTSEPPRTSEDDAPAPIDERTIAGWDHFELSMGFLAGQHRLNRARWSGAAALDPAVLAGPPFGRVEGYGLRYDLRLVVAHVRMTAGIDFPFASYDVDATRTTIDGVRTEVPELKLFGFHFGIGAEYPIGPVAPFVDVLGGLDWATATITRGEEALEVEARDFGFRVRGGLRLHVRRWFFASLSGEVGLTGQPSWAAELSVGFALLAGRDQR